MQEGESPGSVPLAGVRGIQLADDVPEPGDGGSPVYLGSGRRAERASATGCPVPLMGQGCSVRRLSSTVQGVFHRLMVREGIAGALGRGDGGVRLCRGAACGPPFGMGLDVESSGAGWASLVFGTSLRWVSGLDWPHNRTNVLSSQGGDVTLYVNGIKACTAITS